MILDLIRLMLNHKAIGNSPTRKGQRVYLNPRQATSHPTAPYKGSIHACEGTVDFVVTDAAMVRWDNGESGSFRYDRLTVSDFPFNPNPLRFYPNLDSTNPNITFKIWKMEVFGKGDAKEEYIFADDMEVGTGYRGYRSPPSSKFTKMLTQGYKLR